MKNKSSDSFEIKEPNFRGINGQLYLVRCPKCLQENYLPAVASGQCAHCGWKEADEKD